MPCGRWNRSGTDAQPGECRDPRLWMARHQMQAFVYRVTKHTIPGWAPFHEQEPRGFAYETDSHFVHFFGKEGGWWVISPGLTVAQAKSGTLRDWIVATFGASEIEKGQVSVGHTIQGVWRPGIYNYDEIIQGLSTSTPELRLAEQATLLLVERLDELLYFIEPTPETLKTHSHKARELLILACTEVENAWKAYLRISGSTPSANVDFTTRDYVKLSKPLHLEEYEIGMPRYVGIPKMKPFLGWSATQPTKSLTWYDAYNKSKHDRTSHFAEATLWNCLQAVAANLALFSVKFGPILLHHGRGTLAAFVNQLFTIELTNCSPSSFYVPKLNFPPNSRTDLMCFDSTQMLQPRVVDPLTWSAPLEVIHPFCWS